jgi:hypothetical protein
VSAANLDAQSKHFWGWLIFVVSLAMLYALHGLIRVIWPERGMQS